MACVADKIIAAPFAIVGSIGVLAQLPNFNRMLDKHGVDFELMKAGELKRTVTMFGKNTDEDRKHFNEQLEDTHDLFKEFVKVSLTPMLTSLSILNHVNIDSEQEMLGYGISLILLNIGMYAGIPAFGILKLYQFRKN